MPGEGLFFFAASFALLSGFFLQAALMIGPKINRKKFAIAVLAATFIFILSCIFLKGKLYTSETGSVVMAPLLVFLFFLLVLFMEDMLPAISAQTILLYMIFYWFVLFSSFFESHRILYPFLAAIGSIPTLCVLYLTFKKAPMGFYSKLFSYAWFLAIVLFLMAFQTQLPILFESGGDSEIQKNLLASTGALDFSSKLAEIMLSGMFILQQVFYLAVVMYLIQSYRDQPIKTFIEELEKRGTHLTSRFSNYRLPFYWSAILALFQILTLSLNYFLKIIPGQSMIALLALFSLQPIREKERQELPRIWPDEEYAERTEEQKTSDADFERERLKTIVTREREILEKQK